MTKSLVSVIVPTFNRGYCIGRALDSAVGQTYENLEVIVVDDGSTDDTKGIIAKNYSHDARVKYFYWENHGVTAARNQGIRLSQGEYVAFLDSDDTWEPWKLELQVNCLAHFPELGMIWSDMEAADPDGAIINKNYLRTMYSAYQWFTNDQLFTRSYPLGDVVPTISSVADGHRLLIGDIFAKMVMGNLVHTSTVVIKREWLDKVGGFNEEMRFNGEDYDLYLRVSKQGPVGFVNMATIRYQTGMPDRLTVPANRMHVAKNCLRSIQPFLEDDEVLSRLPVGMIPLRLAEVHGWIGEVALDMGQRSEARTHLFVSLRHKPLQARVLWLFAVSTIPFGLGLPARRLYQSVKSKLRNRRVPHVQAGPLR